MDLKRNVFLRFKLTDFNSNFLLTCDDEILEKSNCIETLATNKGYTLKVRNPINYLQENGE